jgi:hypothetical protein
MLSLTTSYTCITGIPIFRIRILTKNFQPCKLCDVFPFEIVKQRNTSCPIRSVMFGLNSIYSRKHTVKLLKTSTGTKKYGQFKGVYGFVRFPLQRINWRGPKTSAGIQGEPIFWGSGLEKFHCICIIIHRSMMKEIWKKADLLILIHFPVSIALRDIFDGHDMKKNYKRVKKFR